MPLFALEDGRAVRLPQRDDANAPWSEQTREAIQGSVTDLVGLSLFTIAERSDDPVLGSYRVALDSSGAAVLVVIIQVLDSPALVASLARSAEVAQVPWRELAAWYPHGPSALRDDWARFRESVPPRGEVAPALVIVAGQIADDVRAAVGVLDQATVTVHEVGLTHRDGQEMLEIGPVAAHRLLPRRFLIEVETGELELGGLRSNVDAIEAARASSIESVIEPVLTEPVVLDSMESQEPEAGVPAETAPAPAPSSDGRRGRRSRAAQEEAPSDQEGLLAVVGLVGEASLVVLSESGGVTGRLTSAGTIVVDGDSYTDPSAAASAALGRPMKEGWTLWHFGAEGPMLGEALEVALKADKPGPTSAGGRRRRP